MEFQNSFDFIFLMAKNVEYFLDYFSTIRESAVEISLFRPLLYFNFIIWFVDV